MNAAPATSVLIVEDERLIAADLQQSLVEFGYDAFSIAASAEEAMAHVAHKCPDVILMDIRIAGPLDGIQTVALLREKCASIVIYITAHSDAALVERAKHTAPHGYLVKPIREAELRTTIEIAVHNRQLESERTKRRTAEQRLNVISDNIPIAVAYFDCKGTVQYANRAFRELVPYQEDPVGVAARTVLDGALYPQSYRARQRALLGETAGFTMDFEQRGDIRRLEVTHFPDHDIAGEVCGVYALSYDVTERERLTADLRMSRLDLETILNAVPANITSWQADLTLRFANKAAKREYGLVKGSMVGTHMREVIGLERFENVASYVDKVLSGQNSIVECTESGNGPKRYTNQYFIPQRQGATVVGMYVLAFDVTELRKSRELIRRLSQRLDLVREEEQRAVATILHDGIAQELFVTKLGVEALAGSAPERLPQLCRELSIALAHCMDATRHLVYSLRPTALTRSGVVVAIREHASYFSTQSHLAIEVRCPNQLPSLSEGAQHLLFRAAQEALTNVARHAHAKQVTITLWSDPDHVWLTIGDDGVGIRADSLLKRGSLGLLGLRERFIAAGGSVTLAREHPIGTIVRFAIPFGADDAFPSRPCPVDA